MRIQLFNREAHGKLAGLTFFWEHDRMNYRFVVGALCA